ncbi:GATA zinc finger-domain-containing protein, partial [Dichotomocladium elegans]
KLECFNCKVTKTPLWRRTPDRAHTLCNACGLYYKQYNQHRPLSVRHKSHQANQLRAHPYATERILTPAHLEQHSQHHGSSTGESNEDDASPSCVVECTNCHQTQTPLWRKNDRGEPVCNACGLYSRLHHRDRPIEMRKTKIQRRRR